MLQSIPDEIGQHSAFNAQTAPESVSKIVVLVEDGPLGPTATIPDAHLLFTADFKRSGLDLILRGDDGKSVVVHDYFASDQHARLLSPEGAALAPDVVSALAGPQAPGEYAQAAAGNASAEAIGRVVKFDGNATIVRNGVAVALNTGDAVLKGDVLQTGSGTLAVTFNDGSTLNLTAQSRLVVNEFVYDPQGSKNSEFLSLVQGSLTFISGEVAHTGNMRIGTPVATMGIRGTVGGVTQANDGTVSYYIVQSATGADLTDNNGTVIAQVIENGPMIVVRPIGSNVFATEVQKSPGELATELAALQHIVGIKAIGDLIIRQFFQDPNNPQSTDHPHTQIQIDLLSNQAHLNEPHGTNPVTVTATEHVTITADPSIHIISSGDPVFIPQQVTIKTLSANQAPILAQAVLQDNFDQENLGQINLNYVAFQNWNVTGSVDLSGHSVDGSGASFEDFYPGTGLHVDMAGTTGEPGALISKTTFGPGTYLLHFDIGGTGRAFLGAQDDGVAVTLGNYHESFVLGDLETLSVTREITLTAGAQLTFADLGLSGNGNIGAILLDVTLAPEPVASGTIQFADPEATDTHTATEQNLGTGYLGTFTLDDPINDNSHVTEANGSGSVAWHFNLTTQEIDSIHDNQVLTQSYEVTIADNHNATATQTVSVSIGGAGGDNFVFNANTHLGADVIVNFKTSSDSIELDGYNAIANSAQLAAALTSNGADAQHGDAVINLGNGDSITVAGVTQDYLQQHLNNLVHLSSNAA